MKKLNFIFGTTLVFASALSIATGLNIGVNQEKVANDSLTMKEAEKKAIFTEAKEELVEETDGL